MSKAEPAKGPTRLETISLKVYIHCKGCEKKVNKILSAVEGVQKINIEQSIGKVTVTGTVDSKILIRKLEKAGKVADLWSHSQAGGRESQLVQPKENKEIKYLKESNQAKEKKVGGAVEFEYNNGHGKVMGSHGFESNREGKAPVTYSSDVRKGGGGGAGGSGGGRKGGAGEEASAEGWGGELSVGKKGSGGGRKGGAGDIRGEEAYGDGYSGGLSVGKKGGGRNGHTGDSGGEASGDGWNGELALSKKGGGVGRNGNVGSGSGGEDIGDGWSEGLSVGRKEGRGESDEWEGGGGSSSRGGNGKKAGKGGGEGGNGGAKKGGGGGGIEGSNGNNSGKKGGGEAGSGSGKKGGGGSGSSSGDGGNGATAKKGGGEEGEFSNSRGRRNEDGNAEGGNSGKKGGSGGRGSNGGGNGDSGTSDGSGDDSGYRVTANRSVASMPYTFMPGVTLETGYSLESAEYATHMFSDENANNCCIM